MVDKLKLTLEQEKYYLKNYGYAGYIAQITTGCCGWKTASWDYYVKGINKVKELEEEKYRSEIEELNVRVQRMRTLMGEHSQKEKGK